MENIHKQAIVTSLNEYVERMGSQNKAANSMKGVSSATLSQMVNNNWELINDEMWRNVASQIGHRDSKWQAVETNVYRAMTHFLTDAKENSLVLAITGNAGTGKTFSVRQFAKANRSTYHLCCNEYWNRKMFMAELLTAMGRDYSGYTVGEMMHEVVSGLKRMEKPLLILDEADKLSDQVLYFFITLYNQLEDECGIILCATDHLKKRLQRGIKLNKKGYNEIWSRIGRKCIELRGCTSADISAICAANGVTGRREITEIIDESENDLRRVKRRIHAAVRTIEPRQKIKD